MPPKKDNPNLSAEDKKIVDFISEYNKKKRGTKIIDGVVVVGLSREEKYYYNGLRKLDHFAVLQKEARKQNRNASYNSWYHRTKGKKKKKQKASSVAASSSGEQPHQSIDSSARKSAVERPQPAVSALPGPATPPSIPALWDPNESNAPIVNYGVLKYHGANHCLNNSGVLNLESPTVPNERSANLEADKKRERAGGRVLLNPAAKRQRRQDRQQ